MFKGIRYVFKLCLKSEKMYIISLFIAEILNVFVVVMNMVMPKYIIDELFLYKKIKYVVIYIAVYLGAILIGNLVINYFKFVSEKKRDSFYTKYSLLHGEKFLKGDYKNLEDPNFLNLSEKAQKYMNFYGFAGIIPLTIILLGKIAVLLSSIIIISTLNVSMLIVNLILISITTYVNSRIKKVNVKTNLEMTESERKSNYIKSVTSDLKYCKEIRLYDLSSWILKKCSKALNEVTNFKKRINKNNNIGASVNTFINFLQQAIAYFYLMIGVFKGEISMGSFAMYLSAIAFFNANINHILSIIIDINQYTSYFQAFKEFIEFPKSLRGGENLNLNNLYDNNYEIEFVNVSFKYPGEKKFALENVSLKIKCGEKISIVGENGAGKTTFIKLLVRLYDPTEGKILLNGVDIKKFNYYEYMKIFSVVFQDYKLFALSIKENISLKESDNVSDKKILEILKDIDMEDKVLNLNNGLETSIYKMFDGNGIEPSGGEGQKLAIARALCKDAPIVILDEPTAALDPRSEADIYSNFYNLVKNKTAIYISHRLASCKFCDKILVFKSGKIVEGGNHNNLMAKNGLYAELFKMQAQFYSDIEVQLRNVNKN